MSKPVWTGQCSHCPTRFLTAWELEEHERRHVRNTPGAWEPSDADLANAHLACWTSAEDGMHSALIAGAGPTIRKLQGENAALREALTRLSEELSPWLGTADAGIPAVVKTIWQCSQLHTANRIARMTLSGPTP